MGGSNVTAIWILVSSIKKTSVELTFCLGCEGIIEGHIDNLRPLGNLHGWLWRRTVTSVGNLAFVRRTSVQAIVMHFSINYCNLNYYLSAGHCALMILWRMSKIRKANSFFMVKVLKTDWPLCFKNQTLILEISPVLGAHVMLKLHTQLQPTSRYMYI